MIPDDLKHQMTKQKVPLTEGSTGIDSRAQSSRQAIKERNSEMMKYRGFLMLERIQRQMMVEAMNIVEAMISGDEVTETAIKRYKIRKDEYEHAEGLYLKELLDSHTEWFEDDNEE